MSSLTVVGATIAAVLSFSLPTSAAVPQLPSDENGHVNIGGIDNHVGGFGVYAGTNNIAIGDWNVLERDYSIGIGYGNSGLYGAVALTKNLGMVTYMETLANLESGVWLQDPETGAVVLAADGSYLFNTLELFDLFVFDEMGNPVYDEMGNPVFSATGQYFTGYASVAMGVGNHAYGYQSVGIGSYNVVGGKNSVSLGVKNWSNGDESVVLGSGNVLTGDQSIAIGTNNSVSGDQSIAIGVGHTITGNNSGAFGDPVTITGSGSYGVGNNISIESDDSFVMGSNVTIAQDHHKAVALGAGTAVNVEGGVALGAGSVANRAAGASGYIPAKADAAAIETTLSKRGAVDVGSRQITGVAAGLADDDAVNVAQLKSLEGVVEDSASHYYSVKSALTGPNSNFNNDGATGTNALAAGPNATATGENSVAVGMASAVTANSAVAIGNAAKSGGSGAVALGGNAKVGDNQTLGAMALGNGAEVITGNRSAAIGANASVSAHNALAVGYKASTTGQNSAAFGAEALAAGKGSLALGHGAKAGQTAGAGKSSFDNAIAIGTDSSAIPSGAIALGLRAQAKNQDVIAIGRDAQVLNSGSLAVGTGATAQGSHMVVIGGSAGAGTTRTTGDGHTIVGYTAGSNMAGQDNTAIGRNAMTNATNVGYSGYVENTALGVNAGGHMIGIQNTALGAYAGQLSDGQNNVYIGHSAGKGNSAQDRTKGSYNVALGHNANLGLSVNHSVALGNQTKVHVDKGVALGAGSVANRAAGTSGYIPAGATASQQAAIGATTSTLAGVSVGDVDNGDFRQIHGVAAGTEDSDAVNVSQLRSLVDVVEELNTGWTVKSDGAIGGNTDGSAIQARDIVDIGVKDPADENLLVESKQDGDTTTIDFSLNQNLKLTSVNAGGTLINSNGLSFVDGSGAQLPNTVFIKPDGIDMGGKKITSLAKGEISATSTDAVNGSQLWSLADSVQKAFGGNVTVNPDGTISIPTYNINGEDFSTVEAAIKKLADGWKVTVSDPSGQNPGTGSGTGGTPGTGTGGPADIKPGDLLNLVAGDNIDIVQKPKEDGNVNIEISVDPNLVVDSVTAGNSKLDTNGLVVKKPGRGTSTVVNGDGLSFKDKKGNKTGPSISIAGIDAGGKKVTNVKNGKIRKGSKDAVNGGQIHNISDSVASALGGGSEVNADGTIKAPTYTVGNKDKEVNNVGDAISELNKGWTLQTNGLNDQQIQSGDIVNFANNDGNIVITQVVNSAGVVDVQFDLGKTISVETVNATTVNASTFKAGNTIVNNNGLSFVNNEGDQVGPSVSVDGINAGGKTITNVAAGVNETDAVNVGQLNGAVTNINNQINSVRGDLRRVDRDARAGTASAAAMANLPQAYLPGKSMFAVSTAGHRGEQGFAAGLSTISDNGKWVLKGSVSGNSRGDTTYGAGVGYQW